MTHTTIVNGSLSIASSFREKQIEAFNLYKIIRRTKTDIEMWCMDPLTVDGLSAYVDTSQWLGGDRNLQAEILAVFHKGQTYRSNIDRVCKVIPIDPRLKTGLTTEITTEVLPEGVVYPELPAWFAYKMDQELKDTPVAEQYRVALPVNTETREPVPLEDSICVLYDKESGIAVTINFQTRSFCEGWELNAGIMLGLDGGYYKPMEGSDWREWMAADALTLMRLRAYA